jgi:7-cyano-7-deazaguanine reductase
MSKSNIKGIKKLGAKKTSYKTDKVRPELLETFETNQSLGGVLDIGRGPTLVPFVQDRDEFTSLCPKTGQPDHAKMEIIYIPNDLMVESKSLKLYLFSFRNTGEFHEDVCNRIANDLCKVLKPKYLRVYGDFAPRGGLAIRPIVERWGKGNTNEQDQMILNIVASWDAKK